MSISLVLFGGLTIFLLLGVPIAISIGFASLLGLIFSKMPTVYLAQGSFVAVDSFPLMAVPFFILAGNLMETGGLSKRLVRVANVLMGSYTGGLATVTVIACAFFAAISGSGPATVAAIGSIMIPAMIKKGYSKDFASAVAASGGALGILIPPSIVMVVYGVVGSVSIGDLFIAGIIPGIVISAVLIAVGYVISKKNGYSGTGEKFSFKEFVVALKDAFWALLAPVIILGGIYGGVFTPTEAAVVAVVYGFVVGAFIYKELKFDQIYNSLYKTAITVGSVMIIIGVATTFGRLMTMYQIPHKMAMFLSTISQNKYVILMLINLFLLFIGMFMETLATVIILTPLLLPVVTNLGVDPIHFGILLVVNSEIGFLTPPLGVNLFVASNISKISIEKITKAILPFIIALFAAVTLLTFVPQISTFLPRLLK
ncbi:MAG: C4-dicarboxylate transporter permease [Anaerosolibacter sp.]|uniref:TRAP transporter large permease n=1 Tax=Anaerosolibacter sp. TaxID=1872527 RepID=UPI0026091D59|nr:TRAP transporter large permease [Anaerosolibacter sp.]MDF2547351.1 C4-dicarboxylate transporter permease [Anaerosolibacter sp.]